MTDRLRIHVNVSITPKALHAVGENAKAIVGRNEKGHFRVDTADMVAEMISRFLKERDFEAYVQDPENYAVFRSRFG